MDNNHLSSNRQSRVTLKDVSGLTGLTPGTISAVLNRTPAARRIPQQTKDRIFAAARELNYQPNPLVRALRTGQAVMSETDVYESGNTRGAFVMDADHFLLAMNAIQQAGARPR
jgi:DNA-binding LacI/PurR family transcriptional regulator